MEPLTNSQIIQLWQAYQGVAMHFNELILQYRLTLMGGLGIGVSVLIYISRKATKEPDSHKQSRSLPTVLSFYLFVIFSCAASLDYFYYHELLLGAVQEIIRFESLYPDLSFSTGISARFDNGQARVIPIIYSAILLILFINFCIQACKYCCYINQATNTPDSK